MKGKYMAYVGSYSYTGKAKGITVFDVDLEKGLFIPRCEEAVNNASYLVVSNNGKVLYSIADEGVVSFRILENGSLARLNTAGIRGMRGCHLSTDASDKYLFVSGFHDGKSTVLRLNKDGSVGEIVDAVFHKGLGTVAERTFRPHITCTRRTPDNKFVMMADSGIDQVKIYRFSEQHEQLTLVDAIRCDLESAPKCFRFSSDGKFIYLVYEHRQDKKKDSPQLPWKKLLPEYVGKNCEIIVKEPLINLDVMHSVSGILRDVDDEWLELECAVKKKKVLKIFRIDNVSSVNEIGGS